MLFMSMDYSKKYEHYLSVLHLTFGKIASKAGISIYERHYGLINIKKVRHKAPQYKVLYALLFD